MLFNIPQYIDVEDKIAGPFTAKQLLWMFGLGATLLVLWNILEKGAFFVAAIPVAVIFMAFAFYRPYSQPLIKFIGSAIVFVIKPKVYSWKRIVSPGQERNRNQEEKKRGIPIKRKEALSADKIEALAKMLDSGGRERNEKIMKIISQRQLKNKK
jgi:hypothetical protein